MKVFGEFWDDAEMAEFLGIQEQSVPMWLKRHGLQRAMLMDARLVQEAKAGDKGQGYRSDLDRTTEDPETVKRLKEEELWKASRSTRI